MCGQNQSVQIGVAADDVVLAEVAEDHIVLTAAFDVVVAVADVLYRSNHYQCAVGITGGADAVARQLAHDRAIALDGVVAPLAEDRVVVGAAGYVVSTEQAVQPIADGDAPVAPFRSIGRGP